MTLMTNGSAIIVQKLLSACGTHMIVRSESDLPIDIWKVSGGVATPALFAIKTC